MTEIFAMDDGKTNNKQKSPKDAGEVDSEATFDFAGEGGSERGGSNPATPRSDAGAGKNSNTASSSTVNFDDRKLMQELEALEAETILTAAPGNAKTAGADIYQVSDGTASISDGYATATSARYWAAPVPSTTVPFLMSRS